MKRQTKEEFLIRRMAAKFRRAEVDKHTVIMNRREGRFIEYTKIAVGL